MNEIINPFFHRGPIRQATYFFDREDETARVFALIKNLQNVAILGQRRIGKTSLLFHLARPETYSKAGLSEERAFFIYVDGQEMGELDEAGVRGYLAKQVVDKMPFDETSEIHSTRLSYHDFRELIKLTTEQGFTVFLLLDEFEALAANSALTPRFFSSLRALSSQFNLAFVTASYRSLFDLTYARTDTLSSPFFNTFAHFPLSLFSESAATEFIRTMAGNGGLSLPEDLVQRIATIAGPHPFFLQMAGYRCWEVLTETNETKIVNKDWEHSFEIEATPHFEYYWNHLSEESQHTLARLPFVCQSNIPSLYRLNEAALIHRSVNSWTYLSPTLERFVRCQIVPDLLQYEPFVLDLTARQGSGSSGLLNITKTEFEALAFLIQNAERVISSEEMETGLWGDEYIEDPERVRAVIKSLRKSLGDDAAYLATKWGEGYILKHPS